MASCMTVGEWETLCKEQGKALFNTQDGKLSGTVVINGVRHPIIHHHYTK